MRLGRERDERASSSGDHLRKLVLQTIADAQLLIARYSAVDVEFALSFHNSERSPLNLSVKRWLSSLDLQTRKAIKEQQKKFLESICPGAVQNVASTEELQERFTSGMAGIVNNCRFFLGSDPYKLDFSKSWVTTRHGIVHD